MLSVADGGWMLALLVGLIPAFGFGMIGPVMQLIGGNATNKQMGMVLAALAVSVVMLIVRPPLWSVTLLLAAAVNGISWSFAEILLIKSFDALGVSRAAPISTGLQLLGASAVGVLFLGEWRREGQLLVGCIALVLVILGVFLSSRPDKAENDKQSNSGAHGLLLVIASSTFYVSYAASGNLFAVDGLDLLFPQALFMVVTTALIGLPMCKWKLFGSDEALFGRKTWQNLGSGAFFAAGNACVLISNQLNGLAVGWTLSQLNVIVSTLGGLILLHERRSARGLKLVIAGMTLVALGGILIGFTKG